MNRFQNKTSPLLYAAIAASLIAVFAADLFTPLGYAVWIVYLVPLAVCLFTWRPVLPLLVALVVTVLMAVTYVTDTPGFDLEMAAVNRLLGLFTAWVFAGVGRVFIGNRIALQTQEWLQSGEAGLSARLVGEQRLDRMGEAVLRYLAELLEAQAGAIFLEDGGSFRRFATYALPAGSISVEGFKPGEGLLGQAVKDRRAFVVREVPDGYLSVGSGLGQGRPRSLLIAPAVVDGEVCAVVELAFTHAAFDSDVELLQRLSEPLATAVRSARFRSRLQELLEETQRQAEELQSQGEELRVNNEELEEQGRALRESQGRLENQQAELEQSNAQLEEQTQLLERQRDDLEQAKAALVQRAQELEQASRYKTEFLANMSHELRTPLNSSLIMAKLLADNPERNLKPEQVRYAQTIQSSNNDLLTLINDILDLAKIEAGRVELRTERVLMSRVMESLARLFQPMAEQKKLVFRTVIVEGAPATLETDRQRLEQVLKNLVSNAIKFTEKGEVSVEAALANDQVLFSVRDTGIGIAESQQQIIFEAFRQADGTTSRKYGGTGLGLSISRELARRLGGELEVSSRPGQGSVFTFRVPVVLEEAEPVAPAVKGFEVPSALPPSTPKLSGSTAAPNPPAPTRRMDDDREKLDGSSRVILVVEDDPHFARLLLDLAHEQGFQCLIASGAEEAIGLAQQFLPTAVLLDIGLPDHSGLSVLDRLKRDARTRHIPVHVVSAGDHAHTALEMGAVGYMLKPVKREQLVQAFERLETRLTQRMRRVLVVEDDPVQLHSVDKLLSSRDVATVGVTSAAECLEMLKGQTFDCMVLDLTLPDSTGFSLLETLSQEDRYAFPPVIVYTGKDISTEEEQKLRRYSKSIIIKGAKSPERLLDEVTLFLHQVVSELPPEKQRMLEEARSRDDVLEGKKILVVEDDVRNVFALTSLLEPRGAQVQIARNGKEAIASLTRSAADLVLMDVMMPEMDGITATREIRKHSEWRKVPIIALTAKAMRDDQEQCLEAGANDYMAKPLDVDKLLSLVRVWMHR
jgi:CheY-like chemotaxis protein/signal transduction histidine kinase